MQNLVLTIIIPLNIRVKNFTLVYRHFTSAFNTTDSRTVFFCISIIYWYKHRRFFKNELLFRLNNTDQKKHREISWFFFTLFFRWLVIYCLKYFNLPKTQTDKYAIISDEKFWPIFSKFLSKEKEYIASLKLKQWMIFYYMQYRWMNDDNK